MGDTDCHTSIIQNFGPGHKGDEGVDGGGTVFLMPCPQGFLTIIRKPLGSDHVEGMGVTNDLDSGPVSTFFPEVGLCTPLTFSAQFSLLQNVELVC